MPATISRDREITFTVFLTASVLFSNQQLPNPLRKQSKASAGCSPRPTLQSRASDGP